MRPPAKLCLLWIIVGHVVSASIVAGPFDVWHRRSPNPSSDYWSSVAYGKGVFAAAGTIEDTGAIHTSSDGLEWIPRFTGNWTFLNAIRFANDRFLAVGKPGSIASSLDGISWIEHSSAVTNNLLDVDYGAGIWVITAEGGTILTSPDLNSWSVQEIGHLSAPGVEYGNGLWVIASQSSDSLETTRIFTSTGGLEWTSSDLETGPNFQMLTFTFVAGRFIIAGNSWRIFESADGIEWTSRDITPNTLSSLIEANGRFYAITDGGRAISSSTNLLDWSEVHRETEILLGTIAHANGIFVATRGTGDILRSVDGETWERPNFGLQLSCFTAVAAKGTMVIQGENPATRSLETYSSPDLKTWNLVSSNGGPIIFGYANGYFLGTQESTSGYYATSSNAVDWLSVGSRFRGTVRGIAFGNGLFVGIGQGPFAPVPDIFVGFSSNRIDWTEQSLFLKGYNVGIGFLNDRFVAFGADGLIIVSTDARAWDVAKRVTPATIFGGAFGNGRYVLVGGTLEGSRIGVALVSSNAVDWSVAGTFSAPLRDIAFADGKFVAVSEGFRVPDRLVISSDGLNWVEHPLIGNAPLFQIARFKDTLVITGNRGVVFQSDPIPQILSARLESGYVTLDFEGADSGQVHLETSTNLHQWEPWMVASPAVTGEFRTPNNGEKSRYFRLASD